ncbi:MAG: protein translocase subunit SecF, partial [Thermodesulfobacteriota bacterium]
MELIKPGTRIDFMGKRKKGIFISIILIVISIGSLIYHKGPNWGFEFTGGTEIHIKLAKDLSIKDIKNTLDATGYPPEVVQQLGLSGDREYLIRFSPDLIKFDQIQDFQSELEK